MDRIGEGVRVRVREDWVRGKTVDPTASIHSQWCVQTSISAKCRLDSVKHYSSELSTVCDLCFGVVQKKKASLKLKSMIKNFGPVGEKRGANNTFSLLKSFLFLFFFLEK